MTHDPSLSLMQIGTRNSLLHKFATSRSFTPRSGPRTARIANSPLLAMVRLSEWIDVLPLVSAKPIKQRFCLASVGNLNSLECAICRSKDLACLGLPTLLDAEPREA